MSKEDEVSEPICGWPWYHQHRNDYSQVRGANDKLNCPKCAQKYECLMLQDAHVIMCEELWTSAVAKASPCRWIEWRAGMKLCFTCYEIVVNETPFLQVQFGGRLFKTHPVRLDRVPGKKKNTYDYRISCPVCGEFTMEKKGIAKEVDVFAGADRGEGEYCIFAWVPDNRQSKL